MEELLEILEEMKPGVDFKSEKHLIDDKVFDSLEITPLMIVPENFQSAQAMWQMIEKLQDE